MLTQTEMHAKRHERTMAARARKKAKSQHWGRVAEGAAWKRDNHQGWLASIGREQERAQGELDARARAAQESRRTVRAMSQHPKPSLMGRIKSFFRSNRNG